METLRKPSLFVLAALVLATTGRAQSAEEIMNKNIQAVGGKDAIASVKSIVYTQTLEVMGQEVSSVTTIVAGKGFKNEIDFQGQKIVQCLTDHGGWGVNPPMGQPTPTAPPDEIVKQSHGRLAVVPQAGWADNDGKLTLEGQDSADYKIHLKNSAGTDVVYYINLKTFLLDKQDLVSNMGGQQVSVTIHFADYRKTDAGLLVAYSWVQDVPNMTLTFTTKTVDVNKPVDPAIFEMPKS